MTDPDIGCTGDSATGTCGADPQRNPRAPRAERTMASRESTSPARSDRMIRRGPALMTAALAALGASAICAGSLPALWRTSPVGGIGLTTFVAAEIAAVAVLLARPLRRTVLLGGAAAGAVIVLWIASRVLGVLPAPDLWQPMDTVLGITDQVCVGLQFVACLGLLAVGSRGPQSPVSAWQRVGRWVLLSPLLALVLAGTAAGVVTASGGGRGTGVPLDTLAPEQVRAGQSGTVEYCRSAGVPLAMDIYAPPVARRSARPAPVALYVHGGGLMLGDRKADGPGAALANSAGALFTPLRDELTSRGFVVASIDYRLAPGAPWPAQITDAKCAVRFLKAHATALGIDPDRIGVWGSSAGGLLASLLGTTGPAAGFDIGQYREQSSSVRAVVDMFGPIDLTDFADANSFARLTTKLALGDSVAVRRSASPAAYLAPGAPPFLIVDGDEDFVARQSAEFAERLRANQIPVTYVPVHGTGHTLDTPTENPTPQQLTTVVAAFLDRALANR